MAHSNMAVIRLGSLVTIRQLQHWHHYTQPSGRSKYIPHYMYIYSDSAVDGEASRLASGVYRLVSERKFNG